MLPFLKNKLDVSASSGSEPIKRESDEGAELDSLEMVCEEVINAVHSKDSKGLAEALKAAFEICESQPHEEEGEHI